MKTAVFLQTISLAVISPIMMWHVGLKENIRWELVLLMIPSQVVSAPLGQFLQDYTPGALLKVIVGVLTIGVAINQLFNIYRARRESGYTILKDTKKEPVYFMIGSERSGSNWLQQLINERHPSIAVPHPPHILNSFFPILSHFVNLSSDSDFERLLNAVCDFVESSPVPWLDKSQSPIQLDRQIVNQQCQDKRTLMMLFEVIMDIFSEANGCKRWVCESMTVGVYHEKLYRHFGDRLRYIYIYRDPRDVCLSFQKAHVGSSHYYVISENVAKQQKIALKLLKTYPLVHAVRYESLHQDQECQMQLLDQFLTKGEPIHDMSFKVVKPHEWEHSYDKDGIELQMVESASWEVMEELGYAPASQNKKEFTVDDIEGFRKQDEEGKEAKSFELKMEDHEDWERRKKQKEIILRAYQDQPKLATNQLMIANPMIATEYGALSTSSSFQTSTMKENLMTSCGGKLKEIGQELGKELWPPRLITMWMFIAGIVAGFLGGLIAVGGPPLIIFFFFYDYPKVQVKANGSLIAVVNTTIRIITYILKPPPPEYGYDTWFLKKDVWLYVAVAVAGILASAVGMYLSRYLNKWTYKAGLAILLTINGITMIVTSVITLTEES